MRKFVLLAALAVFSGPLFARVLVYEATAGERLWVECSPKFGKDVCYAKFTGVESPWADKPIKIKKDGSKYSFDWNLELSNGRHPRTFRLLEGDEGGMELHYQTEGGDAKMSFGLDKDLTKTSQKTDLAAEYKKNPFVPDVD